MELILPPHPDKNKVFEEVKAFLEINGFSIVSTDQSRPWGGFYVIDESQSGKFIDYFFRNVPEAAQQHGKISPKILVVENGKRLSWQYHHRRAEVWKVIAGEVGVVISDSDEETAVQIKKVGDVIILKKSQRHRLIGINEWGIIAEIWQHTEIHNPSDEEDIVRVQDDFGR
jgi:mannose-6-phosphate isomerase-like protein (cupin superfamily)